MPSTRSTRICRLQNQTTGDSRHQVPLSMENGYLYRKIRLMIQPDFLVHCDVC